MLYSFLVILFTLFGVRQGDPELMQVAQYRAEEMARSNVLAHRNPYDLANMVRATGHEFTGGGENIGRTNAPDNLAAANIVNGFWSSTPHRVLLQEYWWDKIGVGYAVSTSGFRYYVVIVTD